MIIFPDFKNKKRLSSCYCGGSRQGMAIVAGNKKDRLRGGLFYWVVVLTRFRRRAE